MCHHTVLAIHVVPNNSHPFYMQSTFIPSPGFQESHLITVWVQSPYFCHLNLNLIRRRLKSKSGSGPGVAPGHHLSERSCWDTIALHLWTRYTEEAAYPTQHSQHTAVGRDRVMFISWLRKEAMKVKRKHRSIMVLKSGKCLTFLDSVSRPGNNPQGLLALSSGDVVPPSCHPSYFVTSNISAVE